MEERICPRCHKAAYSADCSNIWLCPNCGDEIHPDRLLSSQVIVEMHQDGTICMQCGRYMGEKVGDARLCIGCED